MGLLTKRINIVQQRKRHSAGFKAKVVREALRERLTGPHCYPSPALDFDPIFSNPLITAFWRS